MIFVYVHTHIAPLRQEQIHTFTQCGSPNFIIILSEKILSHFFHWQTHSVIHQVSLPRRLYCKLSKVVRNFNVPQSKLPMLLLKSLILMFAVSYWWFSGQVSGTAHSWASRPLWLGCIPSLLQAVPPDPGWDPVKRTEGNTPHNPCGCGLLSRTCTSPVSLADFPSLGGFLYYN